MRQMTLTPVTRVPQDPGGDTVQYYLVEFEHGGWIWRVDELLTRDEAENERDLDWSNVEVTRLYRAPEPELPFDPFRDYGVSDHDFI